MPLIHAKSRGAIVVKTGKTAVLPGFCKIERGGSSSTPLCYRGLIWLGHVLRAGGAPEFSLSMPDPVSYRLAPINRPIYR